MRLSCICASTDFEAGYWKRKSKKRRCCCWRDYEEGGEACWLFAYTLIEGRHCKWCSLVYIILPQKQRKASIQQSQRHINMHLGCIRARKFASKGQLRLQLAPFLRTSRRDWVLVHVSRPRSKRYSSGLLFASARNRLVFYSQAPAADLSTQHRLFSFLL